MIGSLINFGQKTRKMALRPVSPLKTGGTGLLWGCNLTMAQYVWKVLRQYGDYSVLSID